MLTKEELLIVRKKEKVYSLKEGEKDSEQAVVGTYRALSPLVEIDNSLGLTYETMGHVFIDD